MSTVCSDGINILINLKNNCSLLRHLRKQQIQLSLAVMGHGGNVQMKSRKANQFLALS